MDTLAGMSAMISRHHAQRPIEMLSPKWHPHPRLSQHHLAVFFIPCLEGYTAGGNKISTLLCRRPCSCQHSVCCVLCWQIIKQSPPRQASSPGATPWTRNQSCGQRLLGWSLWAVSNTSLSWPLSLLNRSLFGLMSASQ